MQKKPLKHTAMKKMCFLFVLVALCSCGNKVGQNACPQSITAKMSIVDKGTSRWYHSLFWDVEANALATKNRAVVNIDDTEDLYTQPLALSLCLRRPLAEVVEGQDVLVDFDDPVYTELHRDPSLTTYKRHYTAHVNDEASMSTMWYSEFRDGKRFSPEHIEFFVTGDTIYSLNCPDVWGFTPEGLSFCFTDKGVKSIEATCCVYYDVYAIRSLGMRTDNWAWVCRLASEDMPLDVNKSGYYTLPVIEGLSMSSTDRETMEILRGEAIEGWEEFTGENMGDAAYLYDFDNYMVTLNVTYDDGSQREYTHLATAMYYEP